MRPRLAIGCATQRGVRFVKRVLELKPELDLVIFSFREQPWEPAYLDDLRAIADGSGAGFIEATNLASPSLRDTWTKTPVDLLLLVNWRYLVPREVYQRARLGAFAFHDSLLPEYRGFSPTNWAIINGEDHTGASLFHLAEQVDAGDLVDQLRIPIGPDDAIGQVLGQVTSGYLTLLERNLEPLLGGGANRIRQDQAKATYVCRRMPADNEIDWTSSARTVFNLVRAVSAPYPGAFTYLDGRRLTVWKTALPSREDRYVGTIPGRVIDVLPGEGSLVLTGHGSIVLQRVQFDGENEGPASDVLRSSSMTLGPGSGTMASR